MNRSARPGEVRRGIFLIWLSTLRKLLDLDPGLVDHTSKTLEVRRQLGFLNWRSSSKETSEIMVFTICQHDTTVLPHTSLFDGRTAAAGTGGEGKAEPDWGAV